MIGKEKMRGKENEGVRERESDICDLQHLQ